MQIRAGRLLGEGGFAFVYEATDVATGRALCLKRMILGGNPTAEATARKEILLMSRLSGSPGIVTSASRASSAKRRQRPAGYAQPPSGARRSM